jgi:hypothetical protein
MEFRHYVHLLVGVAILQPLLLRASVVLDLQGANFDGTVWTDSSPSGNNAEAIHGSVNIVKTPGGQPALDFANTKGYLELFNPLTAPAFTYSPGFTIFFVGQLPADIELTKPIQPILGGSEEATMSYTLGPLEEGKSEVHQAIGKERVDAVGIGGHVECREWHVLAVTYDGQEYRLYVDGNLKSSGDKALTFDAPLRTYIGYNASDGGVFFNGKIAALVVHDQALPEEDIAYGSFELINRYISN